MPIADRAAASCPAGATEHGSSIQVVACRPATRVVMIRDAVLPQGPAPSGFALLDSRPIACIQLRQWLADLDGPPVSIAVVSDAAEDFLRAAALSLHVP